MGTIAVTIGRYEHNEIKTSIDFATKIADVLDVFFDFLVDNTDIVTVFEKDLFKKITYIQKLETWYSNYPICSLNKSNSIVLFNRKAR